MEFEFIVNNELRKISLEKKADGYHLAEGDRRWIADIQSVSANVLSMVIDGRSFLVVMAKDKEKRHIFVDGQQFLVQEPGHEVKRLPGGDEKTGEGVSLITAPMPGKVIKINVAEQQEVRKNQTLAIVEAMKMENEIKASLEGIVKKVFVSEGELVDSEKTLIELEAKK